MITTHRQLLLRSPMSDQHEDRIDVLFKAVVAIRLNVDLAALEIREATPEEFVQIEADCGPELLSRSGNYPFMVAGGPSVGYVVAGSAWLLRDREPAANPSGLLFDLDDTTPPARIVQLVPGGP
jgi:hypothetical protein